MNSNSNTKTVLMIGYSDQYKKHAEIKEALINAQFKLIVDKVFFINKNTVANNIYNADNIKEFINAYNFDFWYIMNNPKITPVSNIVYGYCIGKGIPQLTDEFVNDIIEMQNSSYEEL